MSQSLPNHVAIDTVLPLRTTQRPSSVNSNSVLLVVTFDPPLAFRKHTDTINFKAKRTHTHTNYGHSEEKITAVYNQFIGLTPTYARWQDRWSKDKWPNGRMAERHMTEKTFGGKAFSGMDIWPKRHSAEQTKGRKTNDLKTNDRDTQDRADIWPKRSLTEN